MKLKASQIRENPHALRNSYPEDKLDQFKASIAAHGLMNPILVRRIPRSGFFWFLKTRYYIVIDGHMRVQAALAIGLRRILVRVVA